MSLEEKMRKLKLTPLPMHKRAEPVLMSLNDKSLPAEIRRRIEKNNVQSIVFRKKTDRVNANYTIILSMIIKTHNLYLLNFI